MYPDTLEKNTRSKNSPPKPEMSARARNKRKHLSILICKVWQGIHFRGQKIQLKKNLKNIISLEIRNRKQQIEAMKKIIQLLPQVMLFYIVFIFSDFAQF